MPPPTCAVSARAPGYDCATIHHAVSYSRLHTQRADVLTDEPAAAGKDLFSAVPLEGVRPLSAAGVVSALR